MKWRYKHKVFLKNIQSKQYRGSIRPTIKWVLLVPIIHNHSNNDLKKQQIQLDNQYRHTIIYGIIPIPPYFPHYTYKTLVQNTTKDTNFALINSKETYTSAIHNRLSRIRLLPKRIAPSRGVHGSFTNTEI